MTLEQAIELIKRFQKWRLGETDIYDFTGAQLTEAINLLLKHAEA